MLINHFCQSAFTLCQVLVLSYGEEKKHNSNTEFFFKKVIYLLSPKCIRICKLTIKKTIKMITKQEFEFKSIRECADKLNLNRKTITSILKGTKQNHYDYTFEYLE